MIFGIQSPCAGFCVKLSSLPGPAQVSASMKSMPGSGFVSDNQETLPHDIFDAATPPSEPRSSKRKDEPSAAELREDYQLKQRKTKKMKPSPGSTTGARLPYNPYSPEVLDSKAKGSEDPFTPDDKAPVFVYICGNLNTDQIYVRHPFS